MSYLDKIGALVQVLSIDDMHLKLSVAPNSRLRINELGFLLIGLLQSKLDLFLLAGMVNHFSHNFFLPFNQSLSSVDIGLDKLFSVIIIA